MSRSRSPARTASPPSNDRDAGHVRARGRARRRRPRRRRHRDAVFTLGDASARRRALLRPRPAAPSSACDVHLVFPVVVHALRSHTTPVALGDIDGEDDIDAVVGWVGGRARSRRRPSRCFAATAPPRSSRREPHLPATRSYGRCCSRSRATSILPSCSPRAARSRSIRRARGHLRRARRLSGRDAVFVVRLGRLRRGRPARPGRQARDGRPVPRAARRRDLRVAATAADGRVPQRAVGAARDLDRDGHDDLYASDGASLFYGGQPTPLFVLGNGDGTFALVVRGPSYPAVRGAVARADRRPRRRRPAGRHHVPQLVPEQQAVGLRRALRDRSCARA